MTRSRLLVLMLALAALLSAGCMTTSHYKTGDTAYASADFAGARAAYQEGEAVEEGGSLFGLAVMYDMGEGVPRDEVKAVEYYQRAAAAGSPEGMTILGLRMIEGEGVPKDPEGGVALLMQAESMGCPLAAATLARMYSEGIIVKKDDALAKECSSMVEVNWLKEQ